MIPFTLSEEFDLLGIIAIPTGSKFLCDPPTTDTDEDYLILLSGNDDQTLAGLMSIGFVPDSWERYEGDQFTSWRRGHVNLIITDNIAFYLNHVKAGELCKKLNLLKKEDRIAVFQSILYNNQ